MSGPGHPITRRGFLRDAAAATVTSGLVSLPGVGTAAARNLRRGKPTVAVLGGGVGGLTAAHELALRGFDVTVYERRAWGGKARSMSVPGTARGGRLPLPAEHGWREVFAGYQNLPDTMRRIPFGSDPAGVLGNLVDVPMLELARDQGRQPLVIPWGGLELQAATAAEGLDAVASLLSWLPPHSIRISARGVPLQRRPASAR